MSDPCDVTSPAFIALMDRHEQTMETLLSSSAFQDMLITHACHTRKWHYDHQLLRMDLLKSGTWQQHQEFHFPRGSTLLVLTQISFHLTRMQAIGEARDFEDILRADPEEVRRVTALLYDVQEAYIKQQTRHQFDSMRKNGWIQ